MTDMGRISIGILFQKFALPKKSSKIIIISDSSQNSFFFLFEFLSPSVVGTGEPSYFSARLLLDMMMCRFACLSLTLENML
jgi:DNA-binding transcriptional MocR family regulator